MSAAGALVLLLAAADAGTSLVDRWTVMQGRGRNGLVAVVSRVRLDRPPRPDLAELTYQVRVDVKYSGAFPGERARKYLEKLGARCEKAVPGAVLVIDRTGDGLQQWVFYARARDLELFRAWVNGERKTDRTLELSVEHEEDPGWELWRALLNMGGRQPLEGR